VQPGLGLLGIFEEPYRLVDRLRWLETGLWERRRPLRAVAVLAAAGLVVFALPMAGGAPSAALRGEPPGGALTAAGGPGAGDEPADAGTAPGRPDGTLAYYIRDVTREENDLLIFRTRREIVHVNELWLGDGRVAQVDNHKTIVYAPRDGRILVTNHDARTFVELPLPFDPATAFGPELARRYAAGARHSLVQPRDGTCEVLDCRCREYAVDTWETRGGEIRQRQTLRVWATTEAPGDLELFHAFLDHLRRLYGRSDAARRELDKIRGYQLALTVSTWHGIWRHRLVNEAVEMGWRAPPAGLFGIPEGYRRVAGLRPEDLL
jgi:hypothetical protein